MDSIEKETKKLENLYIVILKQYKIISLSVLNKTIAELQEIRKNESHKELPNYLLEKKLITTKQHDLIARRIRQYVSREHGITHSDELQTETEEERPKKKKKKFTTFGHFRILHKVATGAMGVIYKVEDTRSKEIMALKILLAGADAKQKQLQRFDREARYAAQLEDPGVVSLLEAGEIKGIPYIAMDFIEGNTLNEYWEEKKDKDYREVVHIGVAISRALAHIHKKGIIHRDIKPANILMDMKTDPPTPKITDFSLAMISDPLEKRLTQTGVTVGTPYYMSPEQTYGIREEVGQRSDMYSLGVVLYEMISGRPPHKAKTLRDLYHKIQKQPPSSLTKNDPDFPKVLEKIIFKSLEKNPRFRYRDCKEFAQTLEGFLQEKKLKITEPTLWSRMVGYVLEHRIRIIRVASFALVMLILFWPLISWWNDHEETSEKNQRAVVLTKEALQLKSQGQPKQALVLLERALKLNPNFPSAQLEWKLLREESKNKTLHEETTEGQFLKELKAALSKGEHLEARGIAQKILKQKKFPPHLENLVSLAAQSYNEQDEQNFWKYIEYIYGLSPEIAFLAIEQGPERDYLLKSIGLLQSGFPFLSLEQLGQHYVPSDFGNFWKGKLLWLTTEEEQGRDMLSKISSRLFFSSEVNTPLLLLAQEKIVPAYYQCQRLLAKQANNGEWQVTAGLIAKELGLYSKAQNYFNGIFPQSSYYLPAQYYRAICLLALNQKSAAIQVWEKLLENYPQASNINYQLGVVFSQLDEEVAKQKCFQYLENPKVLYRVDKLDLSEIYQRIGKFDQAQEFLNQSVEKSSQKNYIQASIFIGKQQYSLAINELLQATKKSPNHCSSQYLLAQELERSRQFSEAILHYEQALWTSSSEEEFEEIFDRWCELCFQKNEHWRLGFIAAMNKMNPNFELPSSWKDKTVDALNKILLQLVKNEKDPWLQLQACISTYLLGEKESSRRKLQKYEFTFSRYSEMYLPMALLYYLDDQLEQALRVVDIFLSKSPQSVEGHFLKGQILLEYNNRKSLDECHQQLINIVEKTPEYAYQNSYAMFSLKLSQKLHKVKEPKKALDILENLVNSQKTYHSMWQSRIYLEKALLEKEKKLSQKASESYAQAIATAPYWYFPYWQAGRFYESHQNFSQALKHYSLSLLIAQEEKNLRMTSLLQKKINQLETP